MQEYRHDLTAEEIRDLVGVSPLMLEIGSHEGTDSIKFLRAMPRMWLHCFEPDPRPIARWHERIGKWNATALTEKMVADVDGEKPFWQSTGKAGHMDDWDYSGGCSEPTGHYKRSPEIAFKPPVMLPSIRLDTWYGRKIDLIDFIWADVQGGQRALIAGGQEALNGTRYLYIECHHPFPLYEGEPSRDELIDLLPGFEPLAIYAQDNILFKSRSLT